MALAAGVDDGGGAATLEGAVGIVDARSVVRDAPAQNQTGRSAELHPQYHAIYKRPQSALSRAVQENIVRKEAEKACRLDSHKSCHNVSGTQLVELW